jgi:thiopeptide-type bacteriocin biosynthesis protein
MESKKQNENNILMPSNLVRKKKYLPEYRKYGGETGISIAENVFAQSSQIVLNILNEPDSMKKIRRLGKALLMMCVGTTAFNFSLEEAIEFFDIYSRYWMQYIPKEEIDVFYKRWDSYFLCNKARITEAVEGLLGLKKYSDAQLFAWYQALSEAKNEIHKNKITVLPQFLPKTALRDFRHDFYLLLNYLHTHNNRQGILVTEEAFLGYLGKEVFSEILGKYHVKKS